MGNSTSNPQGIGWHAPSFSNLCLELMRACLWLKATRITLLQSLPSELPLFLLATCNTRIEELDSEAQEIFKGNVWKTESLGEEELGALFDGIAKAAASLPVHPGWHREQAALKAKAKNQPAIPHARKDLEKERVEVCDKVSRLMVLFLTRDGDCRLQSRELKIINKLTSVTNVPSFGDIAVTV